MVNRGRSEIRFNEALIILISYEAYCLRAGYNYKPFDEAVNDRKVMEAIMCYYDMLTKGINGTNVEESEKEARGIIKRISYTNTWEGLADAFVSLNINLYVGYRVFSILSWYDLNVIIDKFRKRKEGVSTLMFGEMRYGANDTEYSRTISNTILDSVHSTRFFKDTSDIDNPMHAIYLWLLTKDCSITNGGFRSKFIKGDDHHKVVRGNIVFTKILSMFMQSWFDVYAKKYRFNSVDRAASLLYSLPTVSAEITKIPIDETCEHISEYVSRGVNGEILRGNSVTIRQGEKKRAIVTDRFTALSYYSSGKGNYVVTVISTSGEAYVVNMDCDMLMSKSGMEYIDKDMMQVVCDTLDYTIRTDSKHTPSNLINTVPRVWPDILDDDLINNIISSAM